MQETRSCRCWTRMQISQFLDASAKDRMQTIEHQEAQNVNFRRASAHVCASRRYINTRCGRRGGQKRGRLNDGLHSVLLRDARLEVGGCFLGLTLDDASRLPLLVLIVVLMATGSEAQDRIQGPAFMPFIRRMPDLTNHVKPRRFRCSYRRRHVNGTESSLSSTSPSTRTSALERLSHHESA